MKIFSILFLCSILSISNGDSLENDSEESTNNSPDRRKLSIFPKNNMKFIVKPHATDNKKIPEIRNISVQTETRKPLMVKMVPRTKKPNVQTSEVITRKPLMKLRTYTVKMTSKRKKNLEDNTHEDDESRESTLSSVIDDRTKNGRYMSGIKNAKSVKNNILSKFNRNVIRGDILKFTDRVSEEEEQDRHEFIFLKKNKKIEVVDLLSASVEDYETTTTGSIARKFRRKRSSNIIEEENMGTTISLLQYTGRDSRLTNELYFRNINH